MVLSGSGAPGNKREYDHQGHHPVRLRTFHRHNSTAFLTCITRFPVLLSFSSSHTQRQYLFSRKDVRKQRKTKTHFLLCVSLCDFAARLEAPTCGCARHRCFQACLAKPYFPTTAGVPLSPLLSARGIGPSAFAASLASTRCASCFASPACAGAPSGACGAVGFGCPIAYT